MLVSRQGEVFAGAGGADYEAVARFEPADHNEADTLAEGIQVQAEVVVKRRHHKPRWPAQLSLHRLYVPGHGMPSHKLVPEGVIGVQVDEYPEG